MPSRKCVDTQMSEISHELPMLECYELTGRQIILYISDLNFENPPSFSYQLRAKCPISAQASTNSVYDYYNPVVSAEQALVQIDVIQ
jgi:hypothetical protein